MPAELSALERSLLRLGRKLPKSLKQRIQKFAEKAFLPEVPPPGPLSAESLIYHYGSDRLAVCYLACDGQDVRLIEQCLDLLGSSRPIPVICHNPSLVKRFQHPQAEPISYEEFARRQIPILITCSPACETEVEARCRQLWKQTGQNFAIYDAYQQSLVAAMHTTRRYRDVTLHIEPTTLFPTLYSNWDYINIMLKEIGSQTPDVLDMFAGSGVIGFCLKREARVQSISFCDVSFWAVRSMRQTMASDPSLQGNVWLSEGLSGIPSDAQFDLIVGNPPHADVALRGPGTLPGADPNWEAHDLFFRDAHKHLRPGGRIMFEESGDAEVFENYYSSLTARFPKYRLGRYIEQPEHCCFVMEILLT